jgi:NTP pyrophosphatase (non-canonical NTP hydrolase)
MVSDHQQRVAEFVATHDLDAPPAYRLLDAASELGEVAKEINESTDYGSNPDNVEIAADELGDTLFALFALADAAGIDAEDSLETALSKYERRLANRDTAASGE